jgi:hypothetical protein
LYYRHYYLRYYKAQMHCIQFNEPVWVPFSRKEIRAIRRGGEGFLWSSYE